MMPAAITTNVRMLRPQRVVTEGQFSGAVQSPVTSQGVGTQWLSESCVAPANQTSMTSSATRGTATHRTALHRLVTIALFKIVANTGTPTTAMAAAESKEPPLTKFQLVKSAACSRIAPASGVSATVQAKHIQTNERCCPSTLQPPKERSRSYAAHPATFTTLLAPEA